ncbi:RNA polymerase II-associated protein [Laetiporus sulphureus 93-53]|uniref:RNA polymerase II-associated protein n=1 Tax=Laetiporus sulphureus 93-53 TaxID=1314785 RepID=A0A165H2M8_9APHY|nr:RNA polymerase II-associated protein [Laetiporus sulphureus 93-53]KZT11161.1 RNA polymerase II-associated protein [Laetiporus sulphureus 93-53]
MATTTDPLLAFRQAIESRTDITYTKDSEPTSSLAAATHIVLSPTLSLPKNTPTRLRKPGSTSTDPASKPQDFFSLEAVYLAWLLREASGAEYMKQARENGLAVGFVSVTERKNVVDWLEERTDKLSNIIPLASESTTPPGTPPQLRSSTSLPSTSFTSKGVDLSGSLKRRYVADAEDIEVVKKIKQNEIELQDRNTVLRGIKPNNFSAVRSAFTEKLKKLKEASKGGVAAAAAAVTPDPKMQARKQSTHHKNQFPIIMISSSPTALITMHNVKRFLQEAVFEPSQEARARAAAEGNTRPEDLIIIYRKRTTIDPSGRETETQARYFVVDSTEALAKFGADAWDRVVCVMTTGQAWQFRPYKWSEPKTLFHHVKGIYVSWTNDPPNPKIKDWNVTELKIDQHRRHVDKSVVAHFWKTLDSWTMMHKPWLMQG